MFRVAVVEQLDVLLVGLPDKRASVIDLVLGHLCAVVKVREDG